MERVAGAVVDLDALAATRLADAPFRWGYLRQAIAPDHAAALSATFPTADFWRLVRSDDGPDMNYRLRALVPLGARRAVHAGSLAPAWLAFAGELLSPGYRAAFEQAIETSLEGAELEVSAWRWGAAAELGPHPDIPRKIASQVFYFNDQWDPAWGGCLRILASPDPGDCVAELPPALGSASIVVRSDSSWHSVPRVRDDAAGERLSVVATWQLPGSESPFWTVDGDGSVRCHARGASPVGAR